MTLLAGPGWPDLSTARVWRVGIGERPARWTGRAGRTGWGSTGVWEGSGPGNGGRGGGHHRSECRPVWTWRCAAGRSATPRSRRSRSCPRPGTSLGQQTTTPRPTALAAWVLLTGSSPVSVRNPCCTAPTAGWKPPLLAEIGHTLLTRDGAGERRNELPHSAWPAPLGWRPSGRSSDRSSLQPSSENFGCWWITGRIGRPPLTATACPVWPSRQIQLHVQSVRAAQRLGPARHEPATPG